MSFYWVAWPSGPRRWIQVAMSIPVLEYISVYIYALWPDPVKRRNGRKPMGCSHCFWLTTSIRWTHWGACAKTSSSPNWNWKMSFEACFSVYKNVDSDLNLNLMIFLVWVVGLRIRESCGMVVEHSTRCQNDSLQASHHLRVRIPTESDFFILKPNLFQQISMFLSSCLVCLIHKK